MMNEKMEKLFISFNVPNYYAMCSGDSSIISIYEELFSTWQIVIAYRDNQLKIRAYIDQDNAFEVLEHYTDSVDECLDIINSYIVLRNLKV